MPRIELCLPGTPRGEDVDEIAENYRITVERGDGTACGELEARTTMSMYCIQAALSQQKPQRKSQKKA